MLNVQKEKLQTDAITIQQLSALTYIRGAKQVFDIIFLDPPLIQTYWIK